MKALLTALLLVSVTSASAQQVVNVDKMDVIPLNSFFTVSGSPVVNTRFVRLVEGTPYFSEKWMNVVAISEKGERYRSPQAKLDLFDNQLLFLNDKEKEFICTIPLKEITLTDTILGTSYHFVHASDLPFSADNKRGWYQELVKDKVPLYKQFAKVVSENKPYGSSVAEQKISTAETFLVGYNNALYSVKKPKEIPSILADKKKELEQYLQTGAGGNGSNTEKITALVTYYNSLK
ncbi:hypothetical protein HRH25_02745 [Flavisolibacter sp. BT320]|nr:hypothetical protein [Flavisolibacter longurius]